MDRLIGQHQKSAKHEESQWFIGIAGLTARDVARMDADGESCDVTGYGVFHLPENVDRDALYRVVRSIQVKGKVAAPADVKAHYGLK